MPSSAPTWSRNARVSRVISTKPLPPVSTESDAVATVAAGSRRMTPGRIGIARPITSMGKPVRLAAPSALLVDLALLELLLVLVALHFALQPLHHLDQTAPGLFQKRHGAI